MDFENPQGPDQNNKPEEPTHPTPPAEPTPFGAEKPAPPQSASPQVPETPATPAPDAGAPIPPRPPQPEPQAAPQPAPQPTMYNIPDFSQQVYDPYPKKKGSGWKIFWGIVLVLSILTNCVMFMAVLGMGAAFAGGAASDNGLVETIIQEGPRTKKIAVVNIVGVIDGEMSSWVQKQISTAEKDPHVQALIVRIVSPGGAVSSSDQIHHYITRFKQYTKKPVLAFMQSVAASGGYYAAVACDEIMAEHTVITGSIGVIMNHLVVKELLEEKLGIQPVTLKSGPHKDWPSMFNEPSDEEKQYLTEKVITPAYERFVDLVHQGRQNVLSEEEVRKLADGSIYTAPEAMAVKLIDNVGYFEEAVERAMRMANLHTAQVVEYNVVFSFWSMMGAQSSKQINIEAELLEKIAAPRILYLWDGKR